jgi:microcystin degradation protein MlrC
MQVQPLLRAFQQAGIGRTLYGTITSPAALDALGEEEAVVGDSVVLEVGGFTPSGGEPYPIRGVLEYLGEGWSYDRVAAVSFGNGNLVVLTPAYTQVTDPGVFSREVGAEVEAYDVFVVKSRVHFRRGFDETGFARTILVAEAPEPFVGTTFLDALPYENVDLSTLFPYGTPPGR